MTHMSASHLYIHFIGYAVVVIVGTVAVSGLTYFTALSRVLAVRLALVLAILFVFANTRTGDDVFFACVAYDRGPIPHYLATLANVLGSMAFAYLALTRFWPGGTYGLGHPTTRSIARLILTGLVIGVLSATISRPAVWLSMHWDLLRYDVFAMLATYALSGAILQECVFRGRLMQVLGNGTRSVRAILAVQAVIFLSIHIPGYVGVFGSDPVRLVRGFVVVFALGWLYGWLRHRSGSLWLPIVAHASYNLIGLLGNVLR